MQELKDMIAAMKTEFDEAIGEKRQEFESSREEIKVLFTASDKVFYVEALKHLKYLMSCCSPESHNIFT